MTVDIILLPGLHGSIALFDTFVTLAPSWARCRPIPLPAQSNQNFLALAEAIACPVQAVQRPVLLAESYSSLVAVHLTQLLGPDISLLVLCNPLLDGPSVVSPDLAATLVASPLLPSWCAAYMMADGNRSVGCAMLREVRQMPRQLLSDRIRVAAAARSAGTLSSLSVPLLALIGRRDRLLSPSRARAALSLARDRSVIDIDAPHLIVQTHPSSVWLAISERLQLPC